MKKSSGAALLGAALMLGLSAQIASASKPQGTTSDLSVRRHHRHEHYAYRPNDPYPMYYRRPVYYAPKPFLPIPPLWGYGWEWW